MADVGSFLHEVVDDWWRRGPLAVVHALVGDVWRGNVARYEPEARGDDAQSIGVGAQHRQPGRARVRGPGVAVRGGATLEVAFAGGCPRRATPRAGPHQWACGPSTGSAATSGSGGES